MAETLVLSSWHNGWRRVLAAPATWPRPVPRSCYRGSRYRHYFLLSSTTCSKESSALSNRNRLYDQRTSDSDSLTAAEDKL